MSWRDDHFCFACGKNNKAGLKLDFRMKGEKLLTEYTFPKKYQGYSNVVHGGMLSLVLDEVMVNLPWKKYNTPVVSAELNIRLKKPAKIGQKIIFSSEIEKEIKNLIYVKGAAALVSGEVIAIASAKCIKVDIEKIEKQINGNSKNT
ncbi:MAG: PaaI family thioesterase [Candidatus Firestonebacteria bacterium]|nr:PaaI family thioesterase [Candidatus Firestonebacteria bacterium]